MKSFDEEFFLFAVGESGNIGTFFLVKEKFKELNDYFPKDYLTKIISHFHNGFVDEKEHIPYNETILKCISVSSGGYLASLWDMCEEMSMGLNYSLKSFPISQWTIEICNYFDINPYRLMSKNVYLISTNKPIDTYAYLVRSFKNVSFIGMFNNTKKRCRIDCESPAFLTKDHKDELLKIFDKSFLKRILSNNENSVKKDFHIYS